MCQIDWNIAAAWVQAVGSIAAIIAAMWIGERSAKQSRALVELERRRQADIFASTLSMKLHLLGIEIQKKAEQARRIATRVSAGEIAKIDQDTLRNLFLLSQHESVMQLRPNIMFFDRESGILTNTAIDVLESYNPTMSTSISMYEFTGSEPDALVKLCTDIDDRLTYIGEICKQAETRLELVHDLVGEGD